MASDPAGNIIGAIGLGAIALAGLFLLAVAIWAFWVTFGPLMFIITFAILIGFIYIVHRIVN